MVRNASGALSKCSLLSARVVGEDDYAVLLRGLCTRSQYSTLLFGLAFAIAGRMTVDPLLQNRGWFEHHHATRRDRHFSTGLRVTSDTLTLLAHHERTERRQLHRLALLQAIGDLFQNELDKRRRFRPRQTHLLVDRLAQIDTCDC